jgi:transposase
MRQVHPAGERLFVDYAGQTVELIDGATGEVRQAQVFVAVLGASSYTYAEATWTQTLPDWIGAHVRALAFLGGVPRQIVPDNPQEPAPAKAGVGVTKENWYEPRLNPSYQDFVGHYGTAILPARPRRPRDKAKVEAGVLLVERWILARLRHRRVFALAELSDLNDRPMQRLGVSRRRLFEELDRPALAPLPASGQVRRTTEAIRREMKRCAAIEPVIGHLKDGHHFKGRDGSRAHVCGDLL